MIPQFSTFAALYDVYRIDAVEFTIAPRASVEVAIGGTMGPAATQNICKIIVTVDHDDANVPTNYNTLREYGNSKEYYCREGKELKIVFKPAVAMQIYNGITAANSERFSPWVDVANVDVPHYGIKIAVAGTAIANQFTADISARYLLSFKQVR